MAEKRKLLAEIDKCFKKIDEGVDLFEETMNKMHEANSDNQREKYQDDLKKEIKKLQRLRDQVKGWQNSSDIKDKDRLNQYRKVIEQRMEQFKDIERENKTKPHSKQGLSAEEKLDPKEKEKSDTIEWIQSQIRELSDESDRTEMQVESLGSGESGKRRGKKDDSKKGDNAKRMEELKKHLERMKFHIDKLEICMRMVNNESLDSKKVMEVLKDPLEMYIDCLDPDNDQKESDLENLDPEDVYEELDLGALCAQLGTTVNLGSLDDESRDDMSSTHEEEMKSSRHGSTDTAIVGSSPSPASPAPRRTVTAAAVPSTPPVVVAATPQKLTRETSCESAALSSASTNPVTPPPPPPGIPYNSVAAGRAAPAAATPPPTSSSSGGKASFTIPTVARQPNTAAQAAAAVSVSPNVTPSSPVTTAAANDENKNPVVVPEVASGQTKTVAEVVAHSDSKVPPSSTPAAVATHESSESSESNSLNGQPPVETRTPIKTSVISMNGPATSTPTSEVKTAVETTPSLGSNGTEAIDNVSSAEDALRSLRLSHQSQQPASKEPQRAYIPAWLGASPLGRAPASAELETHLAALEAALQKAPLPMDSERPRTYLPKIPCPASPYYPQNPPPNGDTLEYYLRLSPETLFFIFYYMEGTKAQLLAAKALKKLSWRFHTKYLTWFQRHEEPKQITDDFEQGTYVYFDFEKWSQRKKEAFTFEYRYLEDKDFD